MNPELTRSGEGDGQGTPSSAATGGNSGKASCPVDPESEDLLAPGGTCRWVTAGLAHGPLTAKQAPMTPDTRHRPDRCPGALRPWPAEDGLLVRLRTPGGQVRSAQLGALLGVAEAYGDGRVRLTGRANLQLRAMPADPGTESLPEPVVVAIEETGLLPSRTHELARNILASPRTGLAGGRVDLRPLVRELDAGVQAAPALGDLPGRFLFTLDDGSGDLVTRRTDLGLVALADDAAQLRVGNGFGPVVPLAGAAADLVELAVAFQAQRGPSPTAPWHVRELPGFTHPLALAAPPDAAVPEQTDPLPYGSVPGGEHHAVPADGIGRAWFTDRLAAHDHVVITPWGGVFVPTKEN